MTKIVGCCFVRGDEDILPTSMNAMGKIADDIVLYHTNGLEFDEGKFSLELLNLANKHNPDWVVFFDADEEFSPELRDVILNAPADVNMIDVDIYYVLGYDKTRCYRTHIRWHRVFRYHDKLMEWARNTPAFHGGKIQVPLGERKILDSHVPVYHYQCRTYEQTMEKYNWYKEHDKTKIQNSYEHLRLTSEMLKSNDFTGVEWISPPHEPQGGQLSKLHSDQLYPKKSNRIWYLTHVKDGEKSLPRCLKSYKRIADNMLVLIDDRTTDNTDLIANTCGAYVSKFKWKHSFSQAKNECIKEAMKLGLQFGDWVIWGGSDFELQPHVVPEIKEFVSNPQNFFAQFEVPEFSPINGEKVVTRKRKLLWRHHPLIFWERCVHEEACYSAYRLTGQGLPFGDIKWKEFPTLGGSNGMIHYGFHEDGGEEGETFWGKKGYYLVLYQIDRVRNRYHIPETEWGMLQALSYILNRPVNDVDEAITKLTERYSSGDIPHGLAEHFSPEWMMSHTMEYSQ